MKRLFSILIVLCSVAANAATYYVSTTGSNSNDGSAIDNGHAWLTMTYAVAHVAAGDTIRCKVGTYNEQPTVTIDGTAGNMITIMSDDVNNKAVCRGFVLSSVSYFRILGIEITHNSNSFNGAVVMTDCDHVEIIDNYIHHVRGRASGEAAVVSDTHSGTPSRYITIRGNYFYYLGFQSGVFSFANIAAIFSDFNGANGSHHWLIEYNHIERSADFIYSYGQDHILRNNQLHDACDCWPGGGPLPHTDFDQSGSDGVSANTSRKVYEANIGYDNNLSDGHFYLQQNNPGSDTDTDHLLRGNVTANLGSGPFAAMNTPNFKCYNNTIYDVLKIATGKIYRQWGVNNPTGCLFANNLIQNAVNRDAPAIAVETGSATVVTNLGYLSGSDSSFVATSNPLLTDPTSPARDFHIGSTSPARGAGANLVWITSASSSGTTFNVNEGLRLSDGKGITQGDIVRIGSTTTRITSISGNSVTVRDSVTWTLNDPVYWNGNTTADIGALPFGSTTLTSATMTSAGTVYTVSTTGNARGVWFYVNGIPTFWSYDTPYKFTNSSGTVTAKAYALYAQLTPVVDATDAGGGAAVTNYYVSTTGSASNTGLDWFNPWTLSSTLTNTLLTNGVTVWIADGTYTGPFVYANITNVAFRSTNKWGVIISGSSTVGIGGSSSASFLTANLTFDGLQVCSNATDGLFGRRGNLFTNCWSHHNGMQGINISSGTGSSNIIDHCMVENNGTNTSNPGHFHGAYITGQGNIVRNSVFRYNGTGAGIHIYTETAGVLNWDNEVYNNLTYGHTGLYGTLCWNGNEDATHLPGTNRVYGNTILDGLGTAYGTIYVTNNIILPNVIAPTLPIAASGGARTPTVVANYNGSSITITPSGANDVITADFGFVNTTNGLFWLKSISAARNAANPTVYAPIDFFGAVQSSQVDIGFAQYSTGLAADSRILDPSTNPDYWVLPSNFVPQSRPPKSLYIRRR